MCSYLWRQTRVLEVSPGSRVRPHNRYPDFNLIDHWSVFFGKSSRTRFKTSGGWSSALVDTKVSLELDFLFQSQDLNMFLSLMSNTRSRLFCSAHVTSTVIMIVSIFSVVMVAIEISSIIDG